MIQNGANMSVLTNVFLRDYQIKLIPHIKHKDGTESERAIELTNEEALDMLKRSQNYGTEHQKNIDNYILGKIDKKFVSKYGNGLEESMVNLRDRGMNLPAPVDDTFGQEAKNKVKPGILDNDPRFR